VAAFIFLISANTFIHSFHLSPALKWTLIDSNTGATKRSPYILAPLPTHPTTNQWNHNKLTWEKAWNTIGCLLAVWMMASHWLLTFPFQTEADLWRNCTTPGRSVNYLPSYQTLKGFMTDVEYHMTFVQLWFVVVVQTDERVQGSYS
jgi:hypothetical protein